jgi:hypothetical protein
MWLRRGPFLEGVKGEVTVSVGSKGGVWPKEEEASGDTVFAIGKAGGSERGGTNSRVCWNVGPRFEEGDNSRETRTVCLINKTKKKTGVTRRDEDERGLFPDESYEFVEQVVTRFKLKLSPARHPHVLGWLYT